jgi:hypothetical protein
MRELNLKQINSVVRKVTEGINVGVEGGKIDMEKALSDALACKIACNIGSDSLPMIFAGDLGFSNGESTPCELAFGFRRLCPAGWCLTA